MHSIKNIFVIGNGPSSSHTMGPSFACEYILKKYQNIKRIDVFIYGTLALTGKGHLTDVVIDAKLKDVPHQITFDLRTPVAHPNTMLFKTFYDDSSAVDEIISLGGGSLLINGQRKEKKEVYKLSTLKDILKYCEKKQISLYDFIVENEKPKFFGHMKKVYQTMMDAIDRGLKDDSVLPGKLQVSAKAKMLYEKQDREELSNIKYRLRVMSASYAVSEENARGHVVVTAPTCGSCGVIPGVIVYLKDWNFTDEQIIKGLCVGGLIGRIVKTNGTVSGAVAGCQAEVGVACSMAAAMCNFVFGNTNRCVAQAAEIALEHSLGLTCDPVNGYVQIPCIERNAIFAQKAIDSSVLAACIDSDKNKIEFDDIVATMMETGHDMRDDYKETSRKGLAGLFKK